MTRRLTIIIVATVAATLLLAGAGTLVLARLGARQHTEDDLRGQAQSVATTIDDLTNQGAVRILVNLREALHLEGIQVVRFGPAGRTVDTLPPGVNMADLNLDQLRGGKVVSGNHGSLVYAAAAAPVPVSTRTTTRDILAVVVLTRQADVPLRPATGWFLIAAIATLLIGALVAWRFGRRLTRPLREAEDATRKISAGDLSARVPIAHPDDRDELTQLSRSINAMAATLERSQGLERQFLLSISHDLRTPLTSIQGYAEAIADGALPDPTTGGTVILSEAKRLDRLVRDLLDLAKLESRQFSLRTEPVDLIEVAAATVDAFHPEAEEAGVAIELLAPPRSAVVDADTDRLAQVIGNLVQNAMKFAATRIVVRVAVDGNHARLDVSDDGQGIAAEDQPHVFERLYVARHEPRRKETGSGLGLAIVRELVTAMHGDVRAASGDASGGLAGGACLTVELPLAAVSSVPSTTTSPTTTSPTTSSTS